jgi:BRCA1-associated protein
MRSYFFHLRFELCATGADHKKEQGSTAFSPKFSTDIFRDPLPQHSTIPWGETLDSDTKHRRTNSDPLRNNSSDVKSNAPSLQPIHSNLTLRLKSKVTKRPNQRDWRYDNISLISIDMEGPGDGRPRYGRGKSMSQDKPSDIVPGGVATKGKFVPSNPTNTELGWGIVHLYRDAEETPGLYDDETSTALVQGSKTMVSEFDLDSCSTLCILAVPSYMSPSDLLGYVGEQTREDVSHFRLIRTGRANKYMVLMKFRDAKKAKAWQKEWNGKPFNTMEVSYRVCRELFLF